MESITLAAFSTTSSFSYILHCINSQLCFECHLLYSNQYATITPQTVESLCTPKLVALRLLTDGATYHVLIAHKNYNADSHLQGAVTRMLLGCLPELPSL